MRLQHGRSIYEIERRRYMQVDHTWNTEMVFIVFGSIVGFAILFVMMVYIISASQ
jgi:hypothetical protein